MSVPKAAVKLSADGELLTEEDQLSEPFVFRRDWLFKITSAPDHLIMLHVDGDSMVPALEHGDNVLIDLSRTEISSAGLYAIGVGGLVQVKRLELHLKGQVSLLSDNPVYSDYTVHLDDLRIIGKVVWSCHTWYRTDR